MYLVKPKCVLIATDYKEAVWLFPYALDRARESNAELVFLHVVADSEALLTDQAGMPSFGFGEAMERSERDLQIYVDKARAAGVPCRVAVRMGSPEEAIPSAIREFSADLLVLGTRSRTGMQRLLLGSVAESVFRNVEIPVITIGPAAHDLSSLTEAPPKMLYASTMKGDVSGVLRYLQELAALYGAQMEILHVLPPNKEGDRLELETLAWAEQEMKSALAPALLHATEVKITVTRGRPAECILETAEKVGASLIVLGSVRRSPFAQLLQEGTIPQVIARAHCPVMTLLTK